MNVPEDITLEEPGTDGNYSYFQIGVRSFDALHYQACPSFLQVVKILRRSKRI